MGRDLDFVCEKGDLKKLQELMLSYSEEYAKCELQKALDMLRYATWHWDGLFACTNGPTGKIFPYVGIDYAKRYIEKHAGDILEKDYERKTEVGIDVKYRLKNNHDVWFDVSTYDIYGQMDIGIHVPNINKAEETLMRYVKVVALQEVMGLTKDLLIKKYNGRNKGRESRRMDRWSDPDNVFVFRGFFFSLVCDDGGSIIDLRWAKT